MRKLIRNLVLVCALALVASAFGQQSDSLILRAAERISSPDVARDLNLSASQKFECTKLFVEFQNKRTPIVSKLESAPASQIDALNEQISKLKRHLDNSLLSLLTPAQLTRLRQIGIQDEGSEALLDDSIAKELALTAAQKAKISAVFVKVDKAQEGYQIAMAEALNRVPDPGPTDKAKIAAYEAKQQAIRTSMKPQEEAFLAVKTAGNKEIFGVLTPKQRNKWMLMHGKPFIPSSGGG